MRRTVAAFSLIELMIAMTATIFLITTFFRLFNHAARLETNNNLKTNVTLKGEHILDTLENSIRLIGLANTNSDLAATVVTDRIISSADGIAGTITAGNYITDPVNFTFHSPWGGPITKVISATGTTPACTVTIMNSNSLFAELSTLLFINKEKIYTVTFTPGVTGATFTTTAITPTPTVNDCATLFPSSTIVTGPNTRYELSFSNSLLQFRDAVSNRIIFTYPREEIPFFVLQFLTEAEVTGGEGELYSNQLWSPLVSDCTATTPTVCSTIKAVRFGFVMTAREARIDKTPAPNAFKYCLFDDAYCFEAPTNTGKRYVAFSRTVYIRNYDFLKDYTPQP